MIFTCVKKSTNIDRSIERTDILPSSVRNLIIHASNWCKNHLKRWSLSK